MTSLGLLRAIETRRGDGPSTALLSPSQRRPLAEMAFAENRPDTDRSVSLQFGNTLASPCCDGPPNLAPNHLATSHHRRLLTFFASADHSPPLYTPPTIDKRSLGLRPFTSGRKVAVTAQIQRAGHNPNYPDAAKRPPFDMAVALQALSFLAVSSAEDPRCFCNASLQFAGLASKIWVRP